MTKRLRLASDEYIFDTSENVYNIDERNDENEENKDRIISGLQWRIKELELELR